MQSTTLIKLSRQGNAEAISAFMNRALQPQGITVKVKVKADRIKLLLEAEAVPDRRRYVPIVSKGLSKLGLCSIRKVYIYGRQTGSATVDWVAAVDGTDNQYLQMGTGSARAVVASTAPMGGMAERVETSTIAEEQLVRQLQTALSERLGHEELSDLPAPSDIEIEGHDVLVTFETRQAIDSRALAIVVRQVIATLDRGTIKIARLYKRHPRTQRSLPIREILIDLPELAPADTGAPDELSSDSSAYFDTASVRPEPSPPSPSSPQRTSLKSFRYGILGLCGLSCFLWATRLVSPITAIFALLVGLVLWRLSTRVLT
ncbi:MAG: hypothetical protein AAFN18_03190 [Cyanobacteria bacterium J06554_6]